MKDTSKRRDVGTTPRDPGAIWRLLRRFLPFGRPYRGTVAFASVLIVFRVLTDIVQPWPLKVVIDNVLRDRPLHLPWLPVQSQWLESLGRLNLLYVCAAFMLVRTILDGLFTYASSVRMTAVSEHITFDIRKALFARMQKLSLSFFDRHRTGDLVTRFTTDSANIEDMLVGVISVSLVNVLIIATTVAIMFTLDWRLTLVAFTVLPFLYVTNRYFTSRIRAASRERRRREGEIASLVQEDVSLIRSIQAFAREPHEGFRFAIPARDALAAGLTSTRLQAQYAPLSTFITGLGTATVVFFGAQSVLSGKMSLGTLIVLLTYLRSLYTPVKNLSKMVSVVAKATVSAERVAELLDADLEVTDHPNAIDRPALKGRLQLQDVSFAYAGRSADHPANGPQVLQNIFLDIPAGTTVALVGHTGAGKTTIASLLPRFFDPTGGAILIDGHDLRSLRLASLRAQISILPQEPVLFRATIWENIAYGSTLIPHGFGLDGPTRGALSQLPPDAVTAIHAAALAANAHEFIARFPDGYNTLVGERGSTLSGGQRQRIAIARAMIRKAPILILDEPTTGLDAESESLVLEAIDRLKAGRTTLVIAHRLATVRAADQIVVLEHGRVVEQGTHHELYNAAGRYRDYCDRQSLDDSLPADLTTPAVS